MRIESGESRWASRRMLDHTERLAIVDKLSHGLVPADISVDGDKLSHRLGPTDITMEWCDQLLTSYHGATCRSGSISAQVLVADSQLAARRDKSVVLRKKTASCEVHSETCHRLFKYSYFLHTFAL